MEAVGQFVERQLATNAGAGCGLVPAALDLLNLLEVRRDVQDGHQPRRRLEGITALSVHLDGEPQHVILVEDQIEIGPEVVGILPTVVQVAKVGQENRARSETIDLAIETIVLLPRQNHVQLQLMEMHLLVEFMPLAFLTHGTDELLARVEGGDEVERVTLQNDLREFLSGYLTHGSSIPHLVFGDSNQGDRTAIGMLRQIGVARHNRIVLQDASPGPAAVRQAGAPRRLPETPPARCSRQRRNWQKVVPF